MKRMTDRMAQPDETRSFADAEATLYRGARFSDSGNDILADRMTVRHFTGNQDDVLVFVRDGKRRVGRIRLVVHLSSSSSPAIPVTGSSGNQVEETEAEDETKLLVIYDQFETRSYR
jgi:hypothetical protein